MSFDQTVPTYCEGPMAGTAWACGPAGEAPFFPGTRTAGCPFDPPAGLRSAITERPVSRVRIWDGSTPWVVTGHAEQRALMSDPRVSVDDKLPGFPHFHAAIARLAPHR